MPAPGRIVSIFIILRMILGVGCNTVINTRQGELSFDTVRKIRNIENSLDQIGKIVQMRDDMIRRLNIETEKLKGKLDKKSQDLALKNQEFQDCKDDHGMIGFLQNYETDQFEKKIKQQRKHMKAKEKEKHQLEDTISNLKQKLEMVQIMNIRRDREEHELERKQLKELKEEYHLYKEHVFQNLTEVVNQNILLMKVVYSLKEEIKENSLKMKNLQERSNSDNSALKEKEMLINIEPADLENAEVNINKLKSLLEMKDKEIKERDGNIESLTNDLESF